MNRKICVVAPSVVMLSILFITVSSNTVVKNGRSNDKFAYTCLTSDYDKVTDVSLPPPVIYDNTNNGGSAGKPVDMNCFTLNHQPSSNFSCNETDTHFCCAHRGTPFCGGTGIRILIHMKS